ncbi:MAG: C40 family peptidase [Planctomycetes bacterium]|nr:C40 family peptidase [Planctomycetota bacterium]
MRRSGRQVVVGSIVLAICVATGVGSLVHPIHSSAGVWILISAAVSAVVCVLWLAWPNRRLCAVSGVLFALPVAWLALMPGRAVDREALRATYGAALRGYVAAPYVWGGENARGIDCSGLVRRGWIDALTSTAVRRVDAGLMREAIAVWWHDCSARELARGYADRCRQVTSAPSLHACDHNALLPGDLAVTANRAHVLIYLGDRAWISADPAAAAVIVDVSGRSANRYLDTPVDISRWQLLDQAPRER